MPETLHRLIVYRRVRPEYGDIVDRLCGLVGWALGTLRRAGLEAVLELPGDELERPHAAGTGGLSSLGLLAPVVCKRDGQSLSFWCWVQGGLNRMAQLNV